MYLPPILLRRFCAPPSRLEATNLPLRTASQPNRPLLRLVAFTSLSAHLPALACCSTLYPLPRTLQPPLTMSEEVAFQPPIVEGGPLSALSSPGGRMMEAFSAPQTPGGALSLRSMGSQPDMMPLDNLVGSMKGALDHLGGVFDSLGEQCVYASLSLVSSMT